MGNTGNCYSEAGNEGTTDLISHKPRTYQEVINSESNLKIHLKTNDTLNEKIEEELQTHPDTPEKEKKQTAILVPPKTDSTENIPSISGNFIRGKLNGEGIMNYSNGNIYKGN